MVAISLLDGETRKKRQTMEVERFRRAMDNCVSQVEVSEIKIVK